MLDASRCVVARGRAASRARLGSLLLPYCARGNLAQLTAWLVGGPARALSGATLDKPSATAPAVCWHRIVHQHDQNEQLCQLQIKGLLRHWQQVLHQ